MKLITVQGAWTIAVLLALALLHNCAVADNSGPADSEEGLRVRLSITAEARHGQGYWSPGLRIGKDGGYGLRLGTMRAPEWANRIPEWKNESINYVGVDREFCGQRWCGGLGIAKLSDTTYMNGTRWNFGLHIRYAIDKSWSLVLDHYSHGSMLGISEDRSNRGWNLIGVAYTF